jgi:methionyl aminopeptidase
MTLFSRERKDPPIIKSEEEIELIRASCQLVSKTLGELKKHVRPGISTLELDRIAEDFVLSHGGIPAFKDYKQSEDDPPFPGTLCSSVNHIVVHGVPKAEDILQEGDIVTLDIGVCLNGYFGDSAYTFTVGEVKPEILRLLHVTKESLYLGIENAITGKRIGDISFAVQNHVLKHGYSVVKELVGHGIGANLHEPPEVPNYGKRGNGTKLQANWVIAIEPMINMGKPGVVKHSEDGWSILTEDRKPSAHFEHTVVIRKGKAELLTTFDFIEN